MNLPSKVQTAKVRPGDEGLPEPAVRKRRRSRRVARVMLTIAGVTAVTGWGLFRSSVASAMRIQSQPQSLVIVAYALLIVSTVTLVLGLWYLLIAQVERLARIVDADEMEVGSETPLRCGNCGWPLDAPDRFCRHCGRPLGASIGAKAEGAGSG